MWKKSGKVVHWIRLETPRFFLEVRRTPLGPVFTREFVGHKRFVLVRHLLGPWIGLVPGNRCGVNI